MDIKILMSLISTVYAQYFCRANVNDSYREFMVLEMNTSDSAIIGHCSGRCAYCEGAVKIR